MSILNSLATSFGLTGTPSPAPAAPTPAVITAPVRLGDPADTLPADAREKYLRLRDDAAEARAAMAPAADTLSDLRTRRISKMDRIRQLIADNYIQSHGGDDNPQLIAERAELARLDQEFSRVEARHADKLAAWESKNAVVDAVEGYLKTSNGADFRSPPAIALPALAKGHSLADAIAAVRQKVERLRADLQAVEDAPRPSADAIADAKRQLLELAERGRPRVSALVESERGRIEFGELRQRAGERIPDAIAFIAWAFRDQIGAAIEGEIVAASDDASALSPEARAKKRAQVAAALLAAEREEEALVELAAESGVHIARRRDADPRAILGIDGPAPRER